jgi:hypothetical protein
VPTPPLAVRVRRASDYLRVLLMSERYQQLWMRYERERERDLHQESVARVLAAYEAKIYGDDEVPSKRYVHIVSRALRNRSPELTPKNLELFIRAFRITDEEAARLRRLLAGTDLPRAVVGNLPPLNGDNQSQEPTYETILLHEFHYLGPDGKPQRHRTIRDIRSLVDGLTCHRYSFDTNYLTVERISGGTPSPPYERGSNLWAVDITFPRVLNAGDEASLEYLTSFHYSGWVEPCFRRVAHERFENVAIRVEFHPDRLPKRIWWAEWQDYREPNIVELDAALVTLDAENAVYHRVDILERAVIGFKWEFYPKPRSTD